MQHANPDNTPNTADIRFLLNGKRVQMTHIEPTTSVLSYLRDHHQLKGTKEGCAEGDCGACTIVVAELNGDQLELNTINACIQFVPSLAGKAIFTVEYLREQNNGSLHPVQQAMVDHHGSQCGFCTPGFVMSLWSVYNQHQNDNTKPSRQEVRSALTGNLCRCTGYNPILKAADSMLEHPSVVLDDTSISDALRALKQTDSSLYEHETGSFYTPRTTDELLKLRSDYPEATILAGGTDVGLWVNKQFRELNPIIFIGDIDALKTINQDTDHIRIGAGVTLTNAYKVLHIHYPEMDQMWERFASLPIRNIGTLGGNIANGSPIGDSMPALIALGARVVLRSVRGARQMALEELYLDYMKKAMSADEIVETIQIPLPPTNQQFRCYKLSKRHDSDISAIFAGMAITLDGDTISSAKIVFGGMAATPKRAYHCEQTLVGKTWNEATVTKATLALKSDYTPLTDMRATNQYRVQSAENLLMRFYLETRPEGPLAREMVDIFDTEMGAANAR